MLMRKSPALLLGLSLVSAAGCAGRPWPAPVTPAVRASAPGGVALSARLIRGAAAPVVNAAVVNRGDRAVALEPGDFSLVTADGRACDAEELRVSERWAPPPAAPSAPRFGARRAADAPSDEAAAPTVRAPHFTPGSYREGRPVVVPVAAPEDCVEAAPSPRFRPQRCAAPAAAPAPVPAGGGSRGALHFACPALAPGAELTLRWRVRDARSGESLYDVQLPLAAR